MGQGCLTNTTTVPKFTTMIRALSERLRLEIAACQEKLIVCEKLAQNSEDMEAGADRSGHQYQLDKEQADLELQVAEQDHYASGAIIPLLESITPVEDVRGEILEALHQGDGAAKWGHFTAGRHLSILLLTLLQNSSVGQDWGNIVTGRIKRKEQHLQYFRQMREESLMDISRLKEEMAILSRNRVSIRFL